MKAQSRKKFLALFLALSLTLSLAVPTVFAAAVGSTVYDHAVTLTDNLTYSNSIAMNGTYGREEGFSLAVTPGGDVTSIVLPGDGTIYGAASIATAVSHAQSLGYNVLAAMNCDFFSTLTGVPMGLVIENGLYKSSPEIRNAIAYRADGTAFLTKPQVTITLNNLGGAAATQVVQADGTVVLSDNAGKSVSLTHFNKSRTTGGGLYLFSSDYSTISTRTNEAGWMVRLKILEGQMTVSGTMSLEVVDKFETSTAAPIGEGYLILSATTAAGLGATYEQFAVGDTVTLTTACTDPGLSEALWATGGGDVLVSEGAVTDSSQWDSDIAPRNPRTVVGIKADGTLLYYVLDGRKTSYSNGLTLKETAQQMLDMGCVSVLNMDGGGSSAMSVRKPGATTAAVVNSPSDGSLRKCATYILLVSEKSVTGEADRLCLSNDGAIVLAGSSLSLGSLIALDSGNLPVTAPMDYTMTASTGLGSISGSTYTAGTTAGTETITISSSSGATGTAQIHIVDKLSTFAVNSTVSTTAADGTVTPTTTALTTALPATYGVPTQLSVTGTYYGRPVSVSNSAVTYTLTGNQGTGTLTADGLFTPGSNGGSNVTVACAGLTSTLTVTLPFSFADIEGSWAKEQIMTLAYAKIVAGVKTDAGTMFYPANNITRGGFFAMFCSYLGVDATQYASVTLPFADAADIPDWAVNYIKALYSLGYIGGSTGPDGLLYANCGKNITRAEICAMFSQLFTPAENTTLKFTDSADIPDWARVAITTAVQNGIVGGYSDGSMRATANATRAQVAAMLVNLLATKSPSL